MTTPILAMTMYIPVICNVLQLIVCVLCWPVKPWARPDHDRDDPNHRISKEEEK
jgi:hypothetical protein